MFRAGRRTGHATLSYNQPWNGGIGRFDCPDHAVPSRRQPAFHRDLDTSLAPRGRFGDRQRASRSRCGDVEVL
jgi:hypothetical protein